MTIILLFMVRYHLCTYDPHMSNEVEHTELGRFPPSV